MNTTPSVPTIYKKVLEAQRIINEAGVGKTGHFRAETRTGVIEYDYVRAEDVSEAVSKALTTVGVIAIPRYNVKYKKREATNQAGFYPITNVNLELELLDPEDGSSIFIKTVGEGAGMDDKAVRKAVTSAVKIAHILAFNIAVAELDPDDNQKTSIPEPEVAGPTRAQQNIAKAKDVTLPPAEKKVSPVSALQKEIKTAAAAREEGFDYLAFGTAKTGVSQKEWVNDETHLTNILAAITAGEVI